LFVIKSNGQLLLLPKVHIFHVSISI
jgi:hypothetical protein